MKEITAKEGFFLTQNKEEQDRIFVKAIKGVNINESDWRLATQQEKDEYEELNNREIL